MAHFISKTSARIAVLIVPALGVSLPALSQMAPAEMPLPESTQFLRLVDTNLKYQFDEQKLLEGYAYRVLRVEEELDGEDRVKERQTTESEIYRFPQGPFRRVLGRNGTPLTDTESRQQKVAFAAHVEGKKIQKPDDSLMGSRANTPAELGALAADIPHAFDFKLLRRETLNGRASIVVRFRPREHAGYSSRMGKLLLPKVAGLAWIDEEDHRLARVEAEIVDDVKVGVFGLLAKIHKGTVHVQEWRKVDDGMWLPWKQELEFKARSFLVRRSHRRVVEERSAYRKFPLNTAAGPSGEAQTKKQ